MVEGLERLFRRVLLLPILLPVLLFGGWGLGKATARGIALPDGAPIWISSASTTPRAQLESLSAYMATVRGEGQDTEEYVLLYRNHVRPVERSLARWGVEPDLARQVAWPLVEQSYEQGLDPATVVAVVLVESSGRPAATSFVGARGLMQIMPMHQGHYGCGPDMYDIEANLCYGTNILRWNLDRFGGDERRALLAYNGCVRGTNTPNCHTYPDKVRTLRERVREEWRRGSPEGYEARLLGSLGRAGIGPAAGAP